MPSTILSTFWVVFHVTFTTVLRKEYYYSHMQTQRDHSASKWQNQGSNPGRHTLKPMCLITTGYRLFYSEYSRKKSSDGSDRTLLMHGNETGTVQFLSSSILVAREHNSQVFGSRILVKRP